LQVQTLPTARTAEELQFLDLPYILSKSKVLPIAVATISVVLIHGYHPYAQDASIYVPGIERQLNASLFRSDLMFVNGHAKLSIFSSLMAAGMRLLPISLDVFLLLTYLVSIAAFVTGCSCLAAFLSRSPGARWSAALLAACCFTLPAAGTSLLLMDPYVTARSISTPASLFAILACLKRSWLSATLLALLAMAVHPLMGIYLGAFLVLLVLLDQRRHRTATALCGIGFLSAGVLAFTTSTADISSAYREAALSRTYYFLSGWHWYEIVGLLAPILLMAWVWAKAETRSRIAHISAASVLAGSTALLISLCFVHSSSPDFLMRIQVLRVFHLVYLLGLVLIGGVVGERFWESRRWTVAILFAAAGIGMYAGARISYSSSPHIQLPFWATASSQGLILNWIRLNTPTDAVFAADPVLQRQINQDDLGFRATTERSILTDVKDEGIASLFPNVADAWATRRNAQIGLNRLTDTQIVVRLKPYGVSWLLLPANKDTAFSCPYRDNGIAVCQLKQEGE